MVQPIRIVDVGAEDVARVIHGMMDGFEGKDETTVAMACITVAMLMYNPGIQLPDLIRSVKQVSEYISMLLAEEIQ